MGPVRPLALLGVLVALLVAAPLAGGAPGKRVRCHNAVTLKQGKHRGCLARKRLKGPRLSAKTARSRAAGLLTDHGYLKAELPKRLAAPAWKARTATRRALAPLTRRAPAIPAGDGDGGGLVVDPTVATLAPAGQSGGTIEQTTHSKEDGATVEGTSKAVMVADECPNAQGNVPGRVGFTIGFSQRSAPIPGTHRFRAVSNLTLGTTAKITGHVGDDGHVRDYDAVIDVDSTASGKLVGPAGLVHGSPAKGDTHVRFVLTGLKLGAEPSPDQFGSLWDVRENGQGGQFTVKNGEVRVSDKIIDLIRYGVNFATQEASAVLLKSQGVFANGGCLTAHFAPALQLSGSPEVLGVTVTDRAGKPVDINLKGSVSGGTLASSTAHATATQAALFTFRPTGSPTSAGVSVTGASRRGTVSGSTSATKPPAKAYMYTVDLGGSWSYHEHDAFASTDSHTTWDYDTENAGVHAHWANVILRLDGGPVSDVAQGAQTSTVSGATTSQGSHTESSGTSTFTCPSATLGSPPNPNEVGILQVAPSTLTFGPLLPMSLPSGSCTKTGTWFGSPSPEVAGDGIDDLVHETVTVPVSVATMRQPSFTVPVKVSGFPDACTALGANANGHTCTHALTLAATATFKRLYPCVPSGGGGYSCGTAYAAPRRPAK